MNANCLNQKNIEIYLQYLKEQEKSAGTLEKSPRKRPHPVTSGFLHTLGFRS